MKPICDQPLETSGLQIRKARLGDESEIHEAHLRSIREVCIKDHGEQEVLGWGNRPLGERWKGPINQGEVWVLEGGGRIRGVAHMNREAYIHALYLAPEALGRGYGMKLLALMVESARGFGAKSVTLDSTITARGFYRRFGFRESGPMKWSEIGGSQVRHFPMYLEL